MGILQKRKLKKYQSVSIFCKQNKVSIGVSRYEFLIKQNLKCLKGNG